MRTTLLIVALLFALAACGEPQVDPGTNQQPDDTEQDAGNQDADDVDGNNDDGEEDESWHDVDTDQPRDYKGPIGGDREVEPIFPDNYDVEGNHPLLVLLHGYGSDAQETIDGFDANEEASERGVVILAPEGREDSMGEQFWNATDTCCDFEDSGVDDIGYLSDLVEEAVRRYAVDPNRIFFLGISNGGFMSHRMACDRGERVRGIISFNGSTTLEPEDCAPDHPTQIIHVHGTEDETIHYDGNPLAPSARETVERWVDWNECASEPVEGPSVNVTEAVEGDETSIEYWEDCAPQGSVEFWTMEGAEHVPLPLADFPELMFDTILGEQ